jgi:hypothetical protein
MTDTQKGSVAIFQRRRGKPCADDDYAANA